MIINTISHTYDENFDVQSYASKAKLLTMLENRGQYKENLISVFDFENSPDVIQIGNAKYLLNAIIEIDEKCEKTDIEVEIRDIQLKTMLEAEKAEFEIFNVEDEFILKKNGSDLLVAETAYSAKTDLLDYFNFSKFANYCRDKNFGDLIDNIKEYLKEKNATNDDTKKVRLIYKYEDKKFYIRAITSVEGYKDFGINFSVFVALMALNKYVENSKEEIYIDHYKVDDSNLYVSFALKQEKKINQNISLSFNLILENDEIKRAAVSFNGMFKLKWEENNKKSEIFLNPKGVKKDNKNHPVDLLTYRHTGSVEGVFEKIETLSDLISFFINQIEEDSKRISNIKHPDDVRKFINDKVKNSRKAEFQSYKPEIMKKLSSVSVDNTFKLFELLRSVEDLFEHDDVISLNFWRAKLYEALIEKK